MVKYLVASKKRQLLWLWPRKEKEREDISKFRGSIYPCGRGFDLSKGQKTAREETSYMTAIRIGKTRVESREWGGLLT